MVCNYVHNLCRIKGCSYLAISSDILVVCFYGLTSNLPFFICVGYFPILVLFTTNNNFCITWNFFVRSCGNFIFAYSSCLFTVKCRIWFSGCLVLYKLRTFL